MAVLQVLGPLFLYSWAIAGTMEFTFGALPVLQRKQTKASETLAAMCNHGTGFTMSPMTSATQRLTFHFIAP